MRAVLALLALSACTPSVELAERAYERADTLGEKCDAARKLSHLFEAGPEDRRVYWDAVAGLDCARADMEGRATVDGITVVDAN